MICRCRDSADAEVFGAAFAAASGDPGASSLAFRTTVADTLAPVRERTQRCTLKLKYRKSWQDNHDAEQVLAQISQFRNARPNSFTQRTIVELAAQTSGQLVSESARMSDATAADVVANSSC